MSVSSLSRRTLTLSALLLLAMSILSGCSEFVPYSPTPGKAAQPCTADSQTAHSGPSTVPCQKL